jgi:hypothetical protein
MPQHSRSRTVVTPRQGWAGRSLRAAFLKGTAAVLLIVFASTFLQGNWPVLLLCVGGGIGLWGVYDVRRRRRTRVSVLAEVNAMSDESFLDYVADLLRVQGYIVQLAVPAKEGGGALFLTRGKEAMFCRLWRQAKPAGVEVLTEALATTKAYSCAHTMVLATGSFSYWARSVAVREGCILIDGDALATLVSQYRQGHRVLAFRREEPLRARRRK